MVPPRACQETDNTTAANKRARSKLSVKNLSSACVGYSAWFVVDASISDGYQCEPQALSPVGTITNYLASEWIVAFDSTDDYLSLAAPRTLHFDSHGGFSALVRFTWSADGSDQTLFSFQATSTGVKLIFTVSDLTGPRGKYQLHLTDTQGVDYVCSSVELSLGNNVQYTVAIRFHPLTHSVYITEIAEDGGVTDVMDSADSCLTEVGFCLRFCGCFLAESTSCELIAKPTSQCGGTVTVYPFPPRESL